MIPGRTGCGDPRVFENGSGESVCTRCGLVVKGKKFVSTRPRKGTGGNEGGNTAGLGPPKTPAVHDGRLTTAIGRGSKDANGNSFSPKERERARNLRKWQKRARVSDSVERKLAVALIQIDRMASQLGLPRSVRRIASRIYRRALDEGVPHGRSIEEVASASLYAACRESELPRTLREISELSTADGGKIRRAYRTLARELNLSPPPLDPIRYAARLGRELDLPRETRSTAFDLLRELREGGGLPGEAPTGKAAAALYMSSVLTGGNLTQEEVASAADVNRGTVAKGFRKISDSLNIGGRERSWRLKRFAD